MAHVGGFKFAIFGVVGGLLASLFGGWDSGLKTLVIIMSIDYITGLIVAGVFKKSKKSRKGGLQSDIGFKGLCKKGMMLLFVLIAYRLDIVVGSSFIRNAVIIAFVGNEVVSVMENAGLMGVPIPGVIRQMLDILKD